MRYSEYDEKYDGAYQNRHHEIPKQDPFFTSGERSRKFIPFSSCAQSSICVNHGQLPDNKGNDKSDDKSQESYEVEKTGCSNECQNPPSIPLRHARGFFQCLYRTQAFIDHKIRTEHKGYRGDYSRDNEQHESDKHREIVQKHCSEKTP